MIKHDQFPTCRIWRGDGPRQLDEVYWESIIMPPKASLTTKNHTQAQSPL
jgi:hypothetical protein